MADQRAPAAADIEQPVTRREPQLAADHVELVALRPVEVVVPGGREIAAGVDHLVVEKEPVEAVRDIVVLSLIHI